jgi:hypothetical protein
VLIVVIGMVWFWANWVNAKAHKNGRMAVSSIRADCLFFTLWYFSEAKIPHPQGCGYTNKGCLRSL